VRGESPLLSLASALPSLELWQLVAVALAGTALCDVVTFDSTTVFFAAVHTCCAGCLLGCTSVAPLLAYSAAHLAGGIAAARVQEGVDEELHVQFPCCAWFGATCF
jgi:hypothetical protein